MFKKASSKTADAPLDHYDYEELLVDGDLLVFSSCAAVEYNKEPGEWNFNQIISNIEGRLMHMKRRLKARKLRIFFSAKDNYRYVCLPEYKSNRKGAYIPESLSAAKAHITTVYYGELESGLEADDLLCIYQDTEHGTTIIATIDKDIPQCPGHHYRWETQHQGEEIFVVEQRGVLNCELKGNKKKITGNGMRFFCYQLLIGDPTDGIIGCGSMTTKMYKSGVKARTEYTARVGVGPVKAYEALEHALTYAKCMSIVIAYYKHEFGDAWEDRLIAYGRCLFMTRERKETGHFKLWDWRPGSDVWFDPEAQKVYSKLEG